MADLAASSVLLILSAPSHTFSAQPSLPPSLARVPPSLSLISLITRSVGSQPSPRPRCLVLLHMPVRPLRLDGVHFSAAILVGSSIPLVQIFSVTLEHHFLLDFPFIDVVDSEPAIISMNSLVSGVQALSPFELSSPSQSHAQAPSPLLLDQHDWERSLGWGSRLVEPYQLCTAALPMVELLT